MEDLDMFSDDGLSKRREAKIANKAVKRKKVRPHDYAQAEELERVHEKMAPIIIDWYNAKGVGYEFNLHELTLFVMQQMVCSPTSPYRVMADLRKRGLVNYVVLSRKASLYRTMPPVEEYDWDGNMETVFDTDEL